MPLKHAIWKIAEKTKPLSVSTRVNLELLREMNIQETIRQAH